MLGGISELVGRLAAAQSGETIGQALQALAASFRIDSAFIIEPRGPSVVFAAASYGAIEAFEREASFQFDPLALQARLTDRPFLVSEVRRENSSSGGSWWHTLAPPRRAADDSDDGVIVPVRDDEGELAWFVGFRGSKRHLTVRTQLVLSTAAHLAYERFCQLPAFGLKGKALTLREAECLALVSQGRSDLEVAAILSVRPRTVRFHIDNAKRKLGVATRLQAVAHQMAIRKRD